ncbi:MAG: DUF4238 domain-containing protein [Patescibacteria group bacterium]
MSKQNITKRQHYITEALLFHFSDSDSKLFEVMLDNKKIYQTNPNNSMCANFIYEDDNLKTNTVEKYFVNMEGEVVALVKNLIENIHKYKKGEVELSTIKKDIENILPKYIIYYYKSGALLKEFSSINQKEKIPLLLNKILNHNYVNLLADTIKKGYKFALIESDKDFLLSDQFISTSALKIKSRFFQISNRHIGLKETLILIPITSSYYAVYWHSDSDFITEDNTFKVLKNEEIGQINKTIINNSYIKCVGEKRERIEEVVEQYQMHSPLQVYAGGNSNGYFAGAIKKKEVFFYKEEEDAWDMIEFAMFTLYKDLGRNDKCKCKSGKKFKKCHSDAFNRAQTIMKNFGRDSGSNEYGIPGVIVYELPIDEWSNFDKSKK